MLGAPTHSHMPLRNAGQWVIGAAMGLYFTPQVVALVLSLWWVIALNVLWALADAIMLDQCQIEITGPKA